MKKIFFSLCTYLLPLVAFCQLVATPIKIEDGLQRIMSQANKKTALSLPYGDNNLLQQYDNAWKFYNTSKPQNDNSAMLRFDSLIGELDRFFYNDIDFRTRAIGKVSYSNNMFLFAPHFKVRDSVKMHLKKIEIKCAKLFEEKTFTTYSITFSGNIDCNNCEFVVKQTQNILININKDNKILDKLLIGNIEGNDLGRYRLYFYIDTQKIIHLKDFSSDELEDGFLNYEQYQILPNGSFTRYYTADGVVKSNNEQGVVNESKRDGKWIEKKQNYNIDLSNYKNFKDNYTWLEATYKNGIPLGQWNYYKLLQKYDDKGHAIVASRKKGKLLYIENYSNGLLTKKQFIK
jgi:hypothetical protein